MGGVLSDKGVTSGEQEGQEVRVLSEFGLQGIVHHLFFDWRNLVVGGGLPILSKLLGVTPSIDKGFSRGLALPNTFLEILIDELLGLNW